MPQYGDKAPPKMLTRKDSLTFYPCSQCHDHTQSRKLYPLHDVGLEHGQQLFWCLTCHNPNNRDRLTTAQGIDVDFDDAWRICGQCHSARQKDWYYGAHGKRVENWQGHSTSEHSVNSYFDRIDKVRNILATHYKQAII